MKASLPYKYITSVKNGKYKRKWVKTDLLEIKHNWRLTMYYFLDDNSNSRNQAILSHNDYDREVCDNCGAIEVKYKGKFNFRIMGKTL